MPEALQALNNGVPISWYLILSAVLFALGVAGFLFRRNIITVFMCIELMLNAVNLSFVALIVFFIQRGFANAGFVKFGTFTGGSAQSVGLALFTDYLLPFEVTSVLILVAILGAIVLARKEMD